MQVTLTRVTISGADDQVSPAAMAALSANYPFVEWGILFSQSREGQSRYPSKKWRDEVVKLARTKQRMRLSAHLCGSYARSFMDGEDRALIGDYSGVFERVQVNGFDAASAASFIEKARSLSAFEFILQAPNERALFACTWIASTIGRCSVLFDPSGGHGVNLLSVGAPRSVEPWLPIGFAGGIGPHNVEEVAAMLDAAGFRTGNRAETWIDMESGVRDADDVFDIERVVAVLHKIEQWVRA